MAQTDFSSPSSGTLTQNGHMFPVRVYYEDTDFTGIVYHARYLQFFERGRTEWLRLLGILHHVLADCKYGEALACTIRTLSVDYKKPARIDDALAVFTTCEEMGASRFVLRQVLQRDSEEIATLRIEIVMINMAGRPKRVPADIADKLIATT